MNAEITPTRLEKRDPDRLLIEWSDGQTREYRYSDILDNCPCATCREKRSAAPEASDPFSVIKTEEAQPRELLEVRPVGNYAYSFQFNHGCNQGIFTLERLRQLGTVVEE